jgi:hypothetical protein
MHVETYKATSEKKNYYTVCKLKLFQTRKVVCSAMPSKDGIF